MKHKLLLIILILCMGMAAPFVSLSPPIINADGFSPSLAVYVQRGSTEPVLVHVYTQSELEALAITEPQYYSGIDSMPADVHGKGIGVLLSTLVYDLQTYDSGVSFGPGAKLKIYATDTEPDPYTTLTYDYLLGEPRYCFPNLIVDQETNNYDTSDAVEIEPMLCITSYQDRHLTRSELDAGIMDTSWSYRLCFGLLPSDVDNTNPPDTFTSTANNFVYWIDRIDIIVPVYKVTIDGMTGGTVTADKTSAAAGDIVTLTVTPESGKQLVTDTLVASYDDGSTEVLTPDDSNTCTFTMSEYAVTITAEFEDANCTVTFLDEGTTYTTVSAASGTTINAPDNPVREGYNFGGWYTYEDVTNAVSFPYTVTADTILYAKWLEDRDSYFSSQDYSYAVSVDEISGGIATVTTDATDGQAIAETTVTVSISIPEDEYNYQFKSITITGMSETVIPTTEVTPGQTYTFTMPYEDVTVMVKLEDIYETEPSITPSASNDDTISTTENITSEIAGDTVISDTAVTDSDSLTAIPSTSAKPADSPGFASTLSIPGYQIDSGTIVETVTFDLSGLTDASGALTADYKKELYGSENGRQTIRLEIPRGTVSLTKEKTALNFISVTRTGPLKSEKNLADSIIAAFVCGPDGSTFSAPITLGFQYDPATLPAGISENGLGVVYYDETDNAWVKINSEIDTENHIISARVSHFTVFAIVKEKTSPINWWIYGIVIFAAAVIISFIFYKRYKKISELNAARKYFNIT